MSPIVSITIFIISILLLTRSGAIIVTRLFRISKFLKLSEFAVSFIVIAFATSLPDLFVGVMSAFHGKPELSFANIIGANMVTLTLAIGIPVIFARGIFAKSATVRKDSLYAALLAFMPIFLIFDGILSRVDGMLLIAMMGFYIVNVLYQRERFSKIFKSKNNHKTKSEAKSELLLFRQFLRDFSVLFLAIVVLIVSAEGVIRSVLKIVENFNIPIVAMGLFIVAISITLPEIIFGVRAILKKHENMVLGNLIGSVIINSGLVIGLTAVISPIQIGSLNGFFISSVFTVVIALCFAIFLHTDKKISVFEGISLIALYFIFGAITFFSI